MGGWFRTSLCTLTAVFCHPQLYDQPWESYWVDIASGLNATQRTLLHGGVVSAWGDEYCYVAYCLHLDQFPAAHALFPPSADDLFHQSIIGVVFPRTAVAAGSFWNYAASAAADDVASAVDVLNARLAGRGLPTCPQDCGCDAATRCGQQYANETNSMMAVPPNQTLAIDELLALRDPGMAERARQFRRSA